MAAGGPRVDVIDRVKRFREFDPAESTNLPLHNLAETLDKISKFLQDHETSTPDCTHMVFENFPDWWQTTRPSFKLAIAEDSTVDLLYRYMSSLYSWGIPLTLTEKRTPQIKLVQDIDIWGTPEVALTADELLSPDSAFLRLLGGAIVEMYDEFIQGRGRRGLPDAEAGGDAGVGCLDAFVFDSTGFSRTKGVKKTSLRLVWPEIVVDKDTALQVKDYVVTKFRESQDPEIRRLEERVLADSRENTWQCIFSDTVYNVRNSGVRMPLNDRVSPAPMKMPEKRPFAPYGVLRFHTEQGELRTVEKLAEADVFTGEEWLRYGSIRLPHGTELTVCRFPAVRSAANDVPAVVNGNPVNGHSAGGARLGGRPGMSRNGYRVNQRSSGGSGGGVSTSQRQGPPRPRGEDKRIAQDREFDGTVEEFRARLEEDFSMAMLEFEQDQESLSCRYGPVEITFKASNKRVYVTGPESQVKNILKTMAKYIQEVGGDRSEAGSRLGSRAGSEAGGRSHQPSYAPSAVYQPSRAYQPSHVSSRMGRDSQGLSRPSEPTSRITVRDFVTGNPDELELRTGNEVKILRDDSAQDGTDVNRWVYGVNVATQEKGWFSLAYTKPLHLVADAVAEN